MFGAARNRQKSREDNDGNCARRRLHVPAVEQPSCRPRRLGYRVELGFSKLALAIYDLASQDPVLSESSLSEKNIERNA
jgi:hypothetical protein